MPTIEIQPAADYGPLDQAILKLGSYDWLIFTSANGVRIFVERLDRSAIDLRALRARICAIGPATARRHRSAAPEGGSHGSRVRGRRVARAFAAYNLEGARILLPRAAVARDLVPVELPARRAGGRGGSLPHRWLRRRAFDLLG